MILPYENLNKKEGADRCRILMVGIVGGGQYFRLVRSPILRIASAHGDAGNAEAQAIVRVSIV